MIEEQKNFKGTNVGRPKIYNNEKEAYEAKLKSNLESITKKNEFNKMLQNITSIDYYNSLIFSEDNNIKNSILENNKFREYVDVNILDDLLNSTLIRNEIWPNEFDAYNNEYEQMKDFRSNIKKNKDMNLLTTNYKLSSHKYGRAVAVKSLSLSMIRREIRHTIANKYYVDVDIVCAHPCILLNLCEMNNIECKKINEYVKNKEQIYEDLYNKYSINRQEAKTIFIKIMNGAEIDYTLKQANIKTCPQFIKDFYNEIQPIKKMLV